MKRRKLKVKWRKNPDGGYVKKEEYEKLINESREIINKFGGLTSYLKKIRI